MLLVESSHEYTLAEYTLARVVGEDACDPYRFENLIIVRTKMRVCASFENQRSKDEEGPLLLNAVEPSSVLSLPYHVHSLQRKSLITQLTQTMRWLWVGAILLQSLSTLGLERRAQTGVFGFPTNKQTLCMGDEMRFL